MHAMRWGIIGCGTVTETKSGPALQRARHSELLAVMRRSPGLAEDYARRHGVPRWHTDAEAILQAEDIDAVYIATRPDSHCEYTIRAADAGKAVFVEKPMAMSVDESQQMIEACERAGVPLWVAYYRRALPRFDKVRALLASGALGTILAVDCCQYERLRSDAYQNKREAGAGGFFFSAACHTFDILDFLIGHIGSVTAAVNDSDTALTHTDILSASYRFESGAIGGGTWCYDAGAEGDCVTVVGSSGVMTFPVFSPGPIRSTTSRPQEEFFVADPPHVHQPLVQTMVDEFLGSGLCPSTGISALRTARVMEQILGAVG